MNPTWSPWVLTVLSQPTGRPAYHPAILLKIYIYGYLNRIQSSRRLEREVQRNVELMWLTGRLMPDFKTIANLRKDNSKAIRGVCRQFVVLWQQLGLFGENLVAIDGNHHLRAQADDLWSQGSIKAALTCSRSRLMRHAAFALRSFLQERQ
ncbi:transposase [Pseudomonas sp. AP3_22 TE3818]